MQQKRLKHDWSKTAARLCCLAALSAGAAGAWAGPEQAADASAAPSAPAQQPAAGNELARPAGMPIAQATAAQAQEAPAHGGRNPSLDFGPAADLGKLEQSRGGTDVHNDMKLDGVVSGNSAINVVTGANSIDTGAFANMSGIPVVIQNSGANVLIQNATIVNLQFK